ncbi:unknown [Bacteroides sp. CAG:702]|nr:unknown [Bacteroides sp. CAG:702]
MKLILQHSGYNIGRNRSRLLLQFRNLQMPDHHTTYSRIYRPTKWIQLNRIHTGTVKRKHWQCLMRIDIRITMSGKMLADSQHTSIFQTACISNNFPCHFFGVTPERTGIDDWISRIIIHIRHRSEINLHPYFTQLTCHLSPITINQRIILNTSQYPVFGKFGRIFQTHSQSPFTIKSNQQRDPAPLLCQVSQLHLLVYPPLGKQQST